MAIGDSRIPLNPTRNSKELWKIGSSIVLDPSGDGKRGTKMKR